MYLVGPHGVKASRQPWAPPSAHWLSTGSVPGHKALGLLPVQRLLGGTQHRARHHLSPGHESCHHQTQEGTLTLPMDDHGGGPAANSRWCWQEYEGVASSSHGLCGGSVGTQLWCPVVARLSQALLTPILRGRGGTNERDTHGRPAREQEEEEQETLCWHRAAPAQPHPVTGLPGGRALHQQQSGPPATCLPCQGILLKCELRVEVA